MGRGKIDIKRIENASSRQVTFAKRRVGLIKKAQELAILCDADVGLIIFSSSGKRFEFASSSMQNIVKRYMKATAGKEAFSYQSNNHLQDVETLQSTCKHIVGEEIHHLSLHDISHLEKQMDMGLTQVRAQKGRLLLQEMEALNNKGKKLQMENKDLKTKIEEMQRHLKEAQPGSSPKEALQMSLQPNLPNLYVTSTTKKCSPLQLF